MKQLTFSPQTRPPYTDPAPHYEALEDLTAGIVYDEQLDPERFVAIADVAHRVIRAEVHYTPGDAAIALARTERQADCIGLTFAMSALLQSAGVRHEVGFAAGHALLVAPTTGADYFVDPIEASLTGPIILRADPRETAPGTRVSTITPIRHVHSRFLVEKGTLGSFDRQEHHPWANVVNPVRMRLGEAEVGRKALRQRERFIASVGKQHYQVAQNVVTANPHLLPEVESDIRFNDCAQAIAREIARGRRMGLQPSESSQIAHLIDAYTATLPDDGFLSQMRGDLMHALGKATTRRHFLFRSHLAYTDGLRKSGGSYLPEKIAKANKSLKESVKSKE